MTKFELLYKRLSRQFYSLLSAWTQFSFSISYGIVTYENAQGIINKALHIINKDVEIIKNDFVFPTNLKKIPPINLQFPTTSDCKIYAYIDVNLERGSVYVNYEEFCFNSDNFDETTYKNSKDVFEEYTQLASDLERDRNYIWNSMIELQVTLANLEYE